MKFAIIDNELNRCWVIESTDKHNAIAEAVRNGFSEDMADFYYGFEDGQISVLPVEKELHGLQGSAKNG